MVKPAQQRVVGQRRPGPARCSDAGEPMQSALMPARGPGIAKVELLGREVLGMVVETRGAWNVQEFGRKRPQIFKQSCQVQRLNQLDERSSNTELMGKYYGTEPHWIPVASNLQVARV